MDIISQSVSQSAAPELQWHVAGNEQQSVSKSVHPAPPDGWGDSKGPPSESVCWGFGGRLEGQSSALHISLVVTIILQDKAIPHSGWLVMTITLKGWLVILLHIPISPKQSWTWTTIPWGRAGGAKTCTLWSPKPIVLIVGGSGESYRQPLDVWAKTRNH